MGRGEKGREQQLAGPHGFSPLRRVQLQGRESSRRNTCSLRRRTGWKGIGQVRLGKGTMRGQCPLAMQGGAKADDDGVHDVEGACGRSC